MPWPLSESVNEGRDGLSVSVSWVLEASREFWISSEMATARVGIVMLLRRREMTLSGRGRIGSGGVDMGGRVAVVR